MKQFIYVQAVVVNALVGCPSAITFRSTQVSAESEDGAYDLGHVWAKGLFEFRPQAETVNDYVKQVS